MPPVADLVALATPPYAYTAPANANGWRPVVVRPGDTVWGLAAKHGSSVEALVARNRLPRGGHVLYPGQTLLVPGGATPTSAPAARVQSSHVVRSGDTMETIALRHGVTVRQLVRANPGVDPGMIFPGQRLTVPGAAATTTRGPARAARAATATARTHTVRPGETMTSIATAYGISLDRLLAANRAMGPDLLFVGQHVTVPGTAKATSSGVSTRPPAATSANTFAGYTYPPATVRAAAANRARLARMKVPTRTQTAALIRQVALRHGVDPRLALAIAYQESGWNQRMVSVANAVGTMQVIPASGTWASQLAGRRLDLLDTRDNVTAGVLILRALQSTATSREEAVAGYYQGLRSIRTQGMYPDTKGYVRTVLAIYKRM
jgi:LysM repeat protein